MAVMRLDAAFGCTMDGASDLKGCDRVFPPSRSATGCRGATGLRLKNHDRAPGIQRRLPPRRLMCVSYRRFPPAFLYRGSWRARVPGEPLRRQPLTPRVSSMQRGVRWFAKVDVARSRRRNYPLQSSPPSVQKLRSFGDKAHTMMKIFARSAYTYDVSAGVGVRRRIYSSPVHRAHRIGLEALSHSGRIRLATSGRTGTLICGCSPATITLWICRTTFPPGHPARTGRSHRYCELKATGKVAPLFAKFRLRSGFSYSVRIAT